MLPEGLEERYRELRRRPKLRRELKEDRENAIARVEFGTGYDVWVPRVPLDPPRNTAPARPVSAAQNGDTVAGIDGAGRAVLVRRRYAAGAKEPRLRVAHPKEDDDSLVLHVRLLNWLEDRLEIVGLLTSDSVSHVTWVEFDDHDRLVRFARRGVEYNALGKGAEYAECVWDADRCVEVRLRVLSDSGRLTELTRVGEYDGGGLVTVKQTVNSGEPTVAWNRATDGWEEEPLEEAAALEAYVHALGRAAQKGAGELAVANPFMVKLFANWEFPSLIVGGVGYLEAARGRIDPPFEIVHRLQDPSISLIPLLDDAGLLAFRSLRQHELRSLHEVGVRPLHDHQEVLADALEDLVRQLDDIAWPDRAQPFLPFVYAARMGYHEPAEHSSLELARRALGDERVDAFLAAIAPPPDAPRVTVIERPPKSLDDLGSLLVDFGLPDHLSGQAAWGLALVAGGRGASRLGGRPDLPIGQDWPVWEDRPLTHLATIDFSDLPGIDGRELLPADGTLVLLADLTEEGELWEPTTVGADPRIVLEYIPAGTQSHQAKPPTHDRDEFDPPVMLRQRKIRFEPVLTLPERPSGLSAAEILSYEQLTDRLAVVTPGLAEPSHLMLGHPVVVQEDPREPGQVAVLHLGWDEDLGFEFLDGGDLTLFGDESDVRAGRWDRLTLSPASC